MICSAMFVNDDVCIQKYGISNVLVLISWWKQGRNNAKTLCTYLTTVLSGMKPADGLAIQGVVLSDSPATVQSKHTLRVTS